MAYDPCAGHACDHCWICTNLGVCCGQVPNIKALMSPDHFGPPKDRTQEFLEAIAADAPHLSMAELIRLDIEVQTVYDATDDEQEDDGQPTLGLIHDEIYDSPRTDIALTLSLSASAMRQLPPGQEVELPQQADTEETISVRSKSNGEER